MLTIPETIKSLYLRDGVKKNFRVVFPNGERGNICNGEIVKESVRFAESLCSRGVFRFGLCEASCVEFETVGVGNYYGATIRCYIEIDTTSLTAAQISEIQSGNWDGTLVLASSSDLGWGFFRIPLGEFRVESCPRNHEAMAHRRFTAYTADFGRRSSTQPGIPSVNAYRELVADPALWLAQVTGDGLSTVTNAAAGYRASGRIYTPDEHMVELRFYAANGTTRVYPTGLARPGAKTALYSVSGLAVDYAAYQAVGQEIAAKIVSAGISLYCDQTGEQIYPDVASALRDVYPYLFSPALIATPLWYNGNDLSAYNNPIYSYRLENGKRYPIMQRYGWWGYQGGEIWPIGRQTGEVVDGIEYSAQYFSGSTVKIVSVYDVSADQTLASFTLQNSFPTVTAPGTVLSQKLTDASGYEARIKNTGEATISANSKGYNNAPIPRWSYANAVAPNDMASGWLELRAAFGKVERDGSLALTRLSGSNPAGIEAGKIRDAWWDEIDVAPIGAIRFRFQGDDEEQTVEYRFGSGTSLYDRTDNAVLKCIDLPTAEEVLTLLDEQFIPHLGAVGFTPIEMEMRGMPWIEDGDPISVTAGDGTTVQSFALRRELSGVQLLTDEITSAGGNLRESED